MTLTFSIFLLLTLVGFVAGLVDAIAGGGGLLTVPALLLLGLSPREALATNKGQSVFGSGMALARFARSPLLSRPRAAVSFMPALLGAAFGVLLVGAVPDRALTPLVIALLAAVTVFMLFYRPPTRLPALPGPAAPRFLRAITIAFLLAAYDGFFGPGTGTFLILAYVLVFHDPLDAASANAKLVNFASNLAALLVFAAQGRVQWGVALPMALGQALGGYLGAHLTIRVGRTLVRYAVLVVSLALLARQVYGLFR